MQDFLYVLFLVAVTVVVFIAFPVAVAIGIKVLDWIDGKNE